MSRLKRFYYNLNLVREYVPKWGLFEGLREFYANMVDADANFTLEFPSGDECIMSSASHPSLENMFILGEGTKSESTDTIGRFGEGAKVGALALTRR